MWPESSVKAVNLVKKSIIVTERINFSLRGCFCLSGRCDRFSNERVQQRSTTTSTFNIPQWIRTDSLTIAVTQSVIITQVFTDTNDLYSYML